MERLSSIAATFIIISPLLFPLFRTLGHFIEKFGGSSLHFQFILLRAAVIVIVYDRFG